MKASIVATAAVLLTLAQSGLAQTSPPCAAQTVFDQCKKNEDNYLATCQQSDFACLCKWQTAKVSCWDNCPNDIERSTQEGLMLTYCSQPGANVTSSSAASSVMPSTTNALPSSSASSSSASSSAASSDNTSAANMLNAGQMATIAASGIALAAYYIL